MNRQFIAFLLVACGLAACSRPRSDSSTKNVFGSDDRQAVTSNAYPWRTIGYLSTGCTGTLVGRDLVLTAAHCIFADDGNFLAAPMLFYPNMIGAQANESAAITHAWWGTRSPATDTKNDWAIVRIAGNLGDRYGTMGTEELSRGQGSGTHVIVAGYSYDLAAGMTASAHVNCQIREDFGALYYHDCDMARGASGGPMFYTRADGTPYIVGLNVAEYRNGGEDSLLVNTYASSYANIAVPASAWIGKLKEVVAAQ